MKIIIKRIHLFCIYSIQNQTKRSEQDTRQEVLKERITESNIRHQTVAHMDSFTGNESIVTTGKKEHQYKERFAYSRLLLYFSLLFYHRNFAERFPFLYI